MLGRFVLLLRESVVWTRSLNRRHLDHISRVQSQRIKSQSMSTHGMETAPDKCFDQRLSKEEPEVVSLTRESPDPDSKACNQGPEASSSGIKDDPITPYRNEEGYEYLQRGHSTELFKIIISNLPPKIGYSVSGCQVDTLHRYCIGSGSVNIMTL